MFFACEENSTLKNEKLHRAFIGAVVQLGKTHAWGVCGPGSNPGGSMSELNERVGTQGKHASAAPGGSITE